MEIQIILSKLLGEIHDIRDFPNNKSFDEAKNTLLTKKTNQIWQDWWYEK